MHISEAIKVLDKHQPVQMKFWKKSGEIVEAKECVCISSWMRKGTRRIKFLPSMETRMVRDVMIFELNHEEVYI